MHLFPSLAVQQRRNLTICCYRLRSPARSTHKAQTDSESPKPVSILPIPTLLSLERWRRFAGISLLSPCAQAPCLTVGSNAACGEWLAFA